MEKENMQKLSDETLESVTGGAVPFGAQQMQRAKEQPIISEELSEAGLMNDGTAIEIPKEKNKTFL